ncbi:hypothetical protein RhiJN_16161 [Ceratobasidium sp. AG-Ba]|nr:hypothetical protein RhiJN_16161 [Ceratobasidium sp. AG-Ba]
MDVIVNVLASARDPTHTLDGAFALSKPNFSDLRALSCVNREIRVMMMRAWFQTICIREDEDWDEVVRLELCSSVLDVWVLAPAPDVKDLSSNTIFTRFTKSHTVCVEAHDDFVPRDLMERNRKFKILLEAYPHARCLPLFFRLVLPSTLRRLWIVNAHYGVRLIVHVASMGPNLEELSITRCTPCGPRPNRRCEFYGQDLTSWKGYLLVTGGSNASWNFLLNFALTTCGRWRWPPGSEPSIS